MAQKDKPVEEEVGEKAESNKRNDGWQCVRGAKLERLRKKVEKATATTAPALKPKMIWSWSRSRSARRPPRSVATKAPSAIKSTIAKKYYS
jgi:hypothetical protein